MKRELKILYDLGYNSETETLSNGVKIFIPESLASHNWCLTIPDNIYINGKPKEFTMYGVDFATVIQTIEFYNRREKIKELVEESMEQQIEPIDSHTKMHGSWLLVYKKSKKLTYKQMGNVLGVTRQRMEQICKKDTVKQFILNRFAAHENLSLREFMDKYSVLH